MQHQVLPVAGGDALCTDEFSQGRFVPHGLVNARYAEDILCVEARGPFNLELMQALGQLRLALIDQLRSRERFGHMLIIHNSALMSLEAFAQYQRDRAAVYGTAIRFPCANAVVVGPDVEGWQLMASRIRSIYLSDGVPYRVFADASAARRWLLEELAAARRGAGKADPRQRGISPARHGKAVKNADGAPVEFPAATAEAG